MIFDAIDNFGKYTCLHPAFIDIAGFLSRPDMTELPPGKYEIGDRGVFAMVNEYATKDVSQCFIECHRRYIDIQFLVTGRENIGVSCKQDCAEEAYDEERDFQKLYGEPDFIKLKPGLFAIFFPDDGHMPQVSCAAASENVRKVVVKVPVSG